MVIGICIGFVGGTLFWYVIFILSTRTLRKQNTRTEQLMMEANDWRRNLLGELAASLRQQTPRHKEIVACLKAIAERLDNGNTNGTD